MSESFKQLEEFPDYLVSYNGQVVKHTTGRVMRVTYTNRNTPKVGLVRDGVQYWRSVPKLVAEAFVDKLNPTFDTPIQLDNDFKNVRADNLEWRPRWFALEYRRQFHEPHPWANIGPVLEVMTGTVYATLGEVCITNGLLISRSCAKIHNGEVVFPTNQFFRFYK